VTPLFFSFPNRLATICGRSAEYARRQSGVQDDFARFACEFLRRL
jgi:hypothetical protein